MSHSAISQATNVIRIEGEAIAALEQRIDERFLSACELIHNCQGRTVVIGMGKSGHVGHKIAATLASTGSPAFFVHPGEASHGDLGMITASDVIIAISNSGETHEVVTILPIIKNIGCPLIAMSGAQNSSLGRASDVFIDVSVEREACPNDLAPTASTTATLVMGDALAIAVQELRGFTAQDFARTHPAGALGKRLLLYARDLMHSDAALPLVESGASVTDAILEMSSKSLGMVGVVDDQGKLLGMLSDGDLRRTLQQNIDLYRTHIDDIMTANPFTVNKDMLAAELVKIMRDYAQQGPHAINGVFILDDEERVVGALNTHDLLRAGVI